MTDFASEIQALLHSHIEAIIREGTAILEESRRENPSIQLLCEATHKIKGGSGTAGFMDLFQITANLNEEFKRAHKCGGGIDENIRNQLCQLQILLENTKPESSTLYKKYIKT